LGSLSPSPAVSNDVGVAVSLVANSSWQTFVIAVCCLSGLFSELAALATKETPVAVAGP